MNKSKIKVMMEIGKSIYVPNTQIESIATSTWGTDAAPKTKTKTRSFKEESRPDGQHSPSTATSATVTFEQA